jgi:eukaryotic-like serine/threonine-protein kinase
MNPGEILDNRYEIVDRLGAGGMGEVYKAVHTHLGVPRVIKIAHPNISGSTDARDRFLREARTATKVHHPNVATLHDFSTLPNGAHYMVWEFIDGENLSQRLRSHGTLPPRQAIHIVLQALFGLEAIHRAGIVHRDISPENLMITADDTVKIIDMGVAKVEEDAGAVSQTRTGIFVGKLRYAAPEQLGFIPEGEKIDARTDIYAMAMVLFEILTGRPPYEAKSPHEYFMIHANPEPAKKFDLPPELPGSAELQHVLEKALARDRNQRFATARDFAAALEMVELRLPTIRDEDTPTIMSPIGGTDSTLNLGRTTARDTMIRTAQPTVPPTVARPIPQPQPEGVPTQLTPVPQSYAPQPQPYAQPPQPGFPAQQPKQGSVLPLIIIGLLLFFVAAAVAAVMFWPKKTTETQVAETTTTTAPPVTTTEQPKVAEASVTVTSEPAVTTTTAPPLIVETTTTAAPPPVLSQPIVPRPKPPVVVAEQPRPQEPAVTPPSPDDDEEEENPRAGLGSAPRYVDGGDDDNNERALESLRRALRGTKSMSLRGGAMRDELYQAMRAQLPDMEFDGDADVIVRFEGTMERRGRLGLKRRAATATVSKGGRVVFRYELAPEDYRTGDTAAEAFARVIANAVE